MCGRFTLAPTGDALIDMFELVGPMLASEPRYNIAPTESSAVVFRDSETGERRLEAMRWGLIPFWAKKASIGAKMINARSETVAEKSAFRYAIERRRCLVPATGYYEWQKRGREKHPFLIRRPDQAILAMAGLWEIWKTPDDGRIRSFTILTCEATPELSWLHDRMPVLVTPDNFDVWMDAETPVDEALAAVVVPTNAKLETVGVSQYVNKAGNEGEACIEPVATQETLL